MKNVIFQSTTQLTQAIRNKDISSRELLDHYLARVDQHNPTLNAVVTLDIEGARQRADAADAALAKGETSGPLHGLPMTIKDTLETAGIRTTAGFPPFAEHVPRTNATAVERLVQAGAIIFGKTNTPVMAADWQSYNPVFGTTNNPWNVTRIPGGSSGGSAAALTAGLTGLELGSDIGGSVRIPAHYCGVYGHKPSYGIIPLRGHIPGPPGALGEPDIAALGPLARSADDLELALGLLAGPQSDRAVAWRLELPPPRKHSLREYRVAAWLDDAACSIDSAMRAQFETTLEALRKAGAQVNEQAHPAIDFTETLRLYEQLLWPIMLLGLPEEQFEEHIAQAAQLSPTDESINARILRYGTQRQRYGLYANEQREHIRTRWAEFFQDYDVLLCPISPVTAFPHDHSEPVFERTLTIDGQTRPYADQFAWAGLIGMALLPATVAPVGRVSNGLPVGIQIVGPYLEDRTPIDFARHLAEVVGGFEAPADYAG